MKALPLSIPAKDLRSSAFRLTVGGTRLFFNPGVTANLRGADVPLNEARAAIIESASKADAIFVTGYEPSCYNLLEDLPLGAPVYMKAPTRPSEMAGFRSVVAPLAQAGVCVSLGDGACIVVGDAKIEWSPRESALSTITVRGDDRTVLYATVAATALSREAIEQLAAVRPDMIYLNVAGAETGRSADGLAALAVSLLGLVASTGARIFVEGLPLAEPATRRVFRAPLATGRVVWAAEYARERTMPTVAELALAS